MKKSLVGLSLSFCVKDILLGKIQAECVDCIIPSFLNPAIPEKYYEIYWSQWTRDEVDQVLSRIDLSFISSGHNIASGIWIASTDVLDFPNAKRMTTDEVLRDICDPVERWME